MKPQGKEYFISKKVGRAIIDYRMVQDGDRIAVAVSGGKDSLTLLKVLSDRKSFVPIKYSLVAIHVDLGYHCIHPQVLAGFFKKNGYEYTIEKVDLLKGKSRDSISCFWCSWNRRKALFEAADRLKCNKVALGHHNDDIIQTILLNLFFQGEISTMRPRQELFKGRLVIIRPLAYVEEKEIISFAKEQGFPLPHCRCPNSDTSRRNLMAKLIKDLEKTNPNVKKNIFKSIQRIKKDYLL